jgi:two-component system response regulator VicR
MKAKFLVVDDEPKVADSIAQILEEEGYEVITAGDDLWALYYYDEFQPDLIILDILFGDDERMGLDILKKIREKDETIPIIMLTGLSEDELEPRSFKYGAVDFVRKSISTKALLARVEARLPRALRELTVIDDHIKIDKSNHSVKVKRNGEWQSVHFEPKEEGVLIKLVSNPGHVITRERLYEIFFPDTEDPANALNRCIHELRKRLEPDPRDPQYILTKRGVGYYFVEYR